MEIRSATAGKKIRLADIDAPEISEPKCSQEAELGHKAKERSLELMNGGPIVIVHGGGADTDQHGRKLRVVHVNGRSVGDTLVVEGLGTPMGWCTAALVQLAHFFHPRCQVSEGRSTLSPLPRGVRPATPAR
jgi:hypothetical protein